MALALALLAAPAGAQTAALDCVGAEQLEDNAFAVPFARGTATLGPAAEPGLDAILAQARAEPERGFCVLGHAGAQEGGAVTSRQLAARRAAAVAEVLAQRGVARERLRAEIRATSFARAAAVPAERSVVVVMLPAP